MPGGEWEEPWDRQNALDTIRKLERHWYQLDGNDPASGPSGEAAEPVGGSASDDEGPPRKQLKASVNKVCPHVACSAQPVCLVEQLQTVRSNYRGRVDQFRIKVQPHRLQQASGLPKRNSSYDACVSRWAMRALLPVPQQSAQAKASSTSG